MFYVSIAFAIFIFFGALLGFGFWYLFKNKKVELPEDLSVTKKVEEVDPNKNRLLLFAAGLFLSMLLTVMIIEFFTREVKIIEDKIEEFFADDEIIDIPITEIPPPPPPPKIIAPEIVVVQEEPEDPPEIKLPTEDDEPEDEPYVPDEAPPEEEVDVILNIGEVAAKPEFPGGMEKFYQFVADNFKISSRDAAEENKGTIYIQFVVDKSGNVSDIKILRGVSTGLDKEAIRVLKTSPNWKSARNYNGAPVSCRFAIPIKI